MATHFVAQSGNKLVPPLLFVLTFYNFTTVGKVHKTYTHMETHDEPYTSCKDFVNFSAVNP